MINTGVDDVSITLSWFIHYVYMTKYPDIQEKLKLEIRQYPKHLTNDLINRLQYIDLVIKEILRHSPFRDITIRTILFSSRTTNSILMVFSYMQMIRLLLQHLIYIMIVAILS